MNKRYRIAKNQKGFTIIELMISTVVFSVVLLICIQAMVQISRAYYKGITHTRTQEAARNLMDEITQTIQLSGSNITLDKHSGIGVDIPNINDSIGAFCAGNRKYTYAIDRKVVDGPSDNAKKEIRNALVSEDEPCTDSIQADQAILDADIDPVANPDVRSLLGENMRLTRFEISRVVESGTAPIKEGSQLWRVEISIAYADQDLIDYFDDDGNDRVTCKPGTGDEFCSIVEMSTIVARRIG